MEIKYDKSGQPLPWEQQEASKTTQQPVQTPEPTEEPADVQLQNPFVQDYLKSQQVPQQEPESESPALNFEEVAEEPKEIPKKEDHVNFRALKAAAERAERERDEAYRLLRERELREQPRSTQQQETEVDDLDLTEDSFIEPKHVKKLNQKIKALEREQKEYKQKTAQEMQEMMLYRQYPDIERVVSSENLSLLKEMKPTYAKQLADMYDRGDVYGAGDLAYNYMVDLGIHKSKTNVAVKDYAAEKMKAQANAAKPKPIVSGVAAAKSDSPLARAHAFAGELSDADMRKHYQEMELAIRNRGE